MSRKPKTQPTPESPRYAGQAAVERWRAAGVDSVTAKDVADALGITAQGVRGLPIPFTVIGKRDRRYSVSEVERYLVGATKAVG